MNGFIARALIEEHIILYIIISDYGRLFSFAGDTTVDYRTMDCHPHFTYKPEHETCNRYFRH